MLNSLKISCKQLVVMMLLQIVIGSLLVCNYMPQVHNGEAVKIFYIIANFALNGVFSLLLYAISAFLMQWDGGGFTLLIHSLINVSIVLWFRYLSFNETLRDIEHFEKPMVTLTGSFMVFLAWGFISLCELECDQLFCILGAMAGPVGFIVARLTGGQYHGVYNYLFGRVLVSEIYRVSVVFAVVYILHKNQEKSSTWRMAMLFGYLVLTGCLCMICNEYGTFMLTGLTVLGVCLVNEDMRKALGLIVIGGVASAGIACLTSMKVRARLIVLWDPIAAIFSDNEYIRSQTVVMKRFFTYVQYSGFMGSEFRLQKTQCPPNMATDYLFQQIILDMGYLLAIAVAIALVLVVWRMYSATMPGEESRKILDTICIMMICNIICVIAGNMYMFPFSGLSLPVVTMGSEQQANIVFFMLFGWIAGKVALERGA